MLSCDISVEAFYALLSNSKRNREQLSPDSNAPMRE
jgi:hypothetical protein